MKSVINFFLDKSRFTAFILIFIIIGGISSYFSIPKESFPEISIPVVNITVVHHGASAKDIDSQIIQKLELELKNLKDVKEINSTSKFGLATTTIEFFEYVDMGKALNDVRDKVEKARIKMPDDIESVDVEEFSLNDEMPIISVVLSSGMPIANLSSVADKIATEIESLSGVLKVDIRGNRDLDVEILIDSKSVDANNVNLLETLSIYNNNDMLINAGKLESTEININGLVDSLKDIENMPVKNNNTFVTRVGDVASVRAALQDRTSISKYNAVNSITLNVKKRNGANLIETVAGVRYISEEARKVVPNLDISYVGDTSEDISSDLESLTNNVILSAILVLLILFVLLGLKEAILVCISIPVIFLGSLLVLNTLGVTLNVVVLFALTMSIGMLVDSAIVISEYANLTDSSSPYRASSQRMAVPIISSILTTISAFFPLVFWGGVVGGFMKYLPITLIVVLLMSLFISLVALPLVGDALGGRLDKRVNWVDFDAFTKKFYKPILLRVLSFPKITLAAISMGSFLILFLYGKMSAGTEFFPNVESEILRGKVYLAGNYTWNEKSKIIDEVDEILLSIDGVESVSSVVVDSNDLIGRITIDLKDWREREPAKKIIERFFSIADHKIYGPKIILQEQKSGPDNAEAEIMLNLASDNYDSLVKFYGSVFGQLKSNPEIGEKIENIKSNAEFYGYKLNYSIDREKALKHGVDLLTLGQYLKLATNGIKLSEITLANNDYSSDVILRFPKDQRGFSNIHDIRIQTVTGILYLSDFIEVEFLERNKDIYKLDGQYTLQIQVNVLPEFNINTLKEDIVSFIKKDMPPDVKILEKGNAEDQADTMKFLGNAFIACIALMFIILVIQYNSISQVLMTITSIIFSTIGVFFFMLITQSIFGIVMGGIGIIALAGIIINNNIVLIDYYNELKSEMNRVDAIVETMLVRFKPIVLTIVTTVIGLLPMFFTLTIDFINIDMYVGAPTSVMWQQLSAVIIGGLLFSTLVTLIATPCMLVLSNKKEAT